MPFRDRPEVAARIGRARSRLLRLLPAGSRPAAEAESKLWKVICSRCRYEMSLWDIGGVRYRKSKGSISYTFGRCPNCRRLGFMRVRWRGAV